MDYEVLKVLLVDDDEDDFVSTRDLLANIPSYQGQAHGRVNLIVADGGIVRAPLYIGEVELLGISSIPGLRVVFMGDEFILGRGINDRFKVTF